MPRYKVRSLLFSYYDGSLPFNVRKRFERALLLISSEDREVLEDAHIRRVRPFPRKAESEAVDALTRALDVLSSARA